MTRTVVKRLSGAEALESMLKEVSLSLDGGAQPLIQGIRERLSRHGHFSDYKGYTGYSATVKWTSYEDHTEVSVSFRPAISFAPALDDSFAVPCSLAEDGSVEIPVRPPNAVRERNEMPIPVTTEENGSIVEKSIPAARYMRGRKKQDNGPWEAPSRKAALPEVNG